MKTSLITVIVIIISLASYLGIVNYNQSNHVSQNEGIAQSINDDSHKETSTLAEPLHTDELKIKNKLSTEKVSGSVDIQEIVQESFETPLSQEDEYYSFIISEFPQLEDDVTTYRSAVKAQRDNVEIYEAHVSERNKRVAANKSTSPGSDTELTYQRDLLLEQAKELGKQAMLLNEAIRNAAYN